MPTPSDTDSSCFAPLHAQVAAVTQRIVARSQTTRSAYLAQVDAMHQRASGSQRLGCANVAHAFASMPEEPKRVASGLGAIGVSVQRVPHIGIVTAYNDVL